MSEIKPFIHGKDLVGFISPSFAFPSEYILMKEFNLSGKGFSTTKDIIGEDNSVPYRTSGKVEMRATCLLKHGSKLPFIIDEAITLHNDLIFSVFTHSDRTLAYTEITRQLMGLSVLTLGKGLPREFLYTGRDGEYLLFSFVMDVRSYLLANELFRIARILG